MKKDVKWMKGRLEELRRMDMRMWKLCEPNSGEQRHFDGRLAAIEEALEFIDNLDDLDDQESLPQEWIDEYPHSIQKLIHDYEYKTGTFDWATAFQSALHGESEETEVKKDVKWMNDELEVILDEVDELIRRAIDAETTSQTIEMLSGMTIEQVVDGFRDGKFNPKEESEVLSQEWIEGNTSPVDDEGRLYIWKRDLENLIVPKEELTMTKLETLTVPTDLGEWLQSREIGESGAYFSTIDGLFHYWDTAPDSSVFDFISQNKKELIEVILGTRGYRVDKPLYHALIKGHELINNGKIYWNYVKSDGSVLISEPFRPTNFFLSEMTKEEWNKLGINDSNADFVRVEEMAE